MSERHVLLVLFPEVAEIVEPWLEHSVPAIYLAPEPEAPFVRATESLRRRFPDSLHGRPREAVLLIEVASRRWEPQARFTLRST